MIDWNRVAELRHEIGADDFAEVVDMFLEEADEVAATMAANITPDAVESALHFLKGSALNLGFRELAQLCQIGEKAASLGDVGGVNLAQVVAVYERSKSAFTAGKARYAA
ncbi:Hpt domain-containing protein [Pseudorhodobacter antarcticus]|jgi:HPt (histidine-containing phosphotransfer) domain-containing protein|uniref:Hpt domain-containing protein n=1 Tax=Pseudorhodobacter antarcticus TaxID=1077947 RepID=A0A1H8C444_9RHOB|nr:Hpt domain-containing protein [Pseudorhodobacter antarcticus]SEM89224.1 Hpt domain-containing protein [Pseudorhodobacter antarcticus]